MTIGFFLLGSVMMGAGFFMVYRTDLWREWFGDLGAAIGIYGSSWLSWKLFGIVLMLLGFLVAFGLIEIFFWLTIGRLFRGGL